jgi:6-phosphogluconolactonase/glucosamine-6-phosphate isomerase/deaminase
MSDVFLCDVCPTLPFIQESLLGQLSLDSQVVKSNTKEHPPERSSLCADTLCNCSAILIVVVEQTSKAARANYPAYLRAV